MSSNDSNSKRAEHPSLHTTDWDSVRALMRRPAMFRPLVRSQLGPVFGNRLSKAPRKTEALPREVLDPAAFRRLMELEKRRADRSRASLSVVVFERTAADAGLRNGLVDILHANQRETDALGDLDDRRVGVLLPDTDAAGACVFSQKIISRVGEAGWTSHAATYPDDLFERLSGIADSEPGAWPPPGTDAEEIASRGAEDTVKRVLDVVLSLLLIVAFAPVMIVTALAIKLTSRGPVIFRQSRLGKGGASFDFYKFRSMRVSNDDSIHRAFVADLIQGRHADINQQSDSDPLFKIKHDPRVTRVGRFIRSTSIDELPQLFNVLKGDMSLVGPRPPLAYEAAQYQSWHLRRILEIRPGITGLWQVEGRSRVSFDDMVRMDLRYIRDRSLALDLKLLVRTVGVVLARQGAK